MNERIKKKMKGLDRALNGEGELKVSLSGSGKRLLSEHSPLPCLAGCSRLAELEQLGSF